MVESRHIKEASIHYKDNKSDVKCQNTLDCLDHDTAPNSKKK